MAIPLSLLPFLALPLLSTLPSIAPRTHTHYFKTYRIISDLTATAKSHRPSRKGLLSFRKGRRVPENNSKQYLRHMHVAHSSPSAAIASKVATRPAASSSNTLPRKSTDLSSIFPSQHTRLVPGLGIQTSLTRFPLYLLPSFFYSYCEHAAPCTIITKSFFQVLSQAVVPYKNSHFLLHFLTLYLVLSSNSIEPARTSHWPALLSTFDSQL